MVRDYNSAPPQREIQPAAILRATRALEEFGYFKVLRVENVTTDEEKEERAASWRKYQQEEHEKLVKSLPPGVDPPLLDLTKLPTTLPYCYAIIARRKNGAGD